MAQFYISKATPSAQLLPKGKGLKHGAMNWKMFLIRRIAYLVLFSNILMLAKPMMPVLMDAMAHTFWEQEHILTVHEVNGKFHVHQEVVKAAKHLGKEKQNNSVKSLSEDYVSILPDITFTVFSYPVKSSHYQSYLCFDVISSLSMNYPPPKSLRQQFQFPSHVIVTCMCC
jgi:hypothetical protein